MAGEPTGHNKADHTDDVAEGMKTGYSLELLAYMHH